MINTIPALVWSAQSDGSVDFINQRWEGYTGLMLEEGLDWNWGVTVYPDDVGRFMDERCAALASGRPMKTEARVRAADGEYRWLLIRNVPVRDELGKIGKLLILSRRHRPDKVLVTVRDSGPGIDPQSLEKIFEAFSTTKPQGMGTGLTNGRSIVERHGGSLWAEPNQGPGATFQFTLLGTSRGANAGTKGNCVCRG